MKITVTGSLGNIGKPLTEQLVQKGHSVTVISSNAEKQKDIEALGAAAAIGSVEDIDFLVSAFTGADAVFAMVPPSYTEPDQVAYYSRIGSSYAQAVSRAGVKHVVDLSSYGAHLESRTGFIVGSHRVEGIFDALQDTAVTHLRPGYFYYNLYNFKDMIKHAGMIGANYGGDDIVAFVSPADIAAAAAEELTVTAAGNGVRYVASDEHTCSEAAHILGAAIGKPDLQWLTLTDGQYKDNLVKNGLNEHAADMLTELGAATHSGILREDYEQNKPAVMGKVKLEDFAKEFAAAYQQG